MALYLSETEVRRLLPMETAMDAVRDSLKAMHRGEAVNRPRDRARTKVNVLNAMAAGWPPYSGVKVYSIGRARTQFVFLLFGSEGELAALMEADVLGQIRTGAASGVATEALARPDASVLALLGTGWQARSQLEAVCRARPIRTVRVFGRDEGRRRSFCARMSGVVEAEILPSASAEECVRGADVVTTITTARDPFVAGAWLEPGVHVNAAGSNFAHRRELDEEAVARADFIAVDSVEQARRESGDLIVPVESGRLRWEDVRELGAVLVGETRGRERDDDVTLFKSNGLALWDVAVAARVYERARDEGVGEELEIGARSLEHREY